MRLKPAWTPLLILFALGLHLGLWGQASAQPSRPAAQHVPPQSRALRLVPHGAKRAEFCKQYQLKAQIASPLTAAPAAHQDRIAHGSWNIRKAARLAIYNSKPSDHGKKHLQARTEREAAQFSMRAAQYLPGLDNAKLERQALQRGLWVQRPNGAMWGLYKFDRPVGYDGGEPTHWIRAELSSGTVHGHPMKLERVRKYIKNAN